MSAVRTSLFEILVTGIVVAVSVTFLLTELDPLDTISRANDTKVQRDIQVLAMAIDRYLVVSGKYPRGDVQQTLISAGELNTRLIPPNGYQCNGTLREYAITVERIVRVSCVLQSKRYTKLGKTHWVWCSDSGKAGPTNGDCP